MSLNWTDAQAIAQELFDTYPDLDPENDRTSCAGFGVA